MIKTFRFQFENGRINRYIKQTNLTKLGKMLFKSSIQLPKEIRNKENIMKIVVVMQRTFILLSNMFVRGDKNVVTKNVKMTHYKKTRKCIKNKMKNRRCIKTNHYREYMMTKQNNPTSETN